MGFFDWLTGAPPAPEPPKPPAPPPPLLIAPPGGACMVGADADGNPTTTFIPEGVWLPELGTVNHDARGNPINYFGSNGWNPMPINPELLKFKPYLVPIKQQ